MTMFRLTMATVGILLGAAAVQAGDVFRLALPSRDAVPAMKLGEVTPEAETIDVWRGGGFRGGYHGGFRGGYYGGYRGGYWGGYRGGYWGGGVRVYGGYGGFGGYGYRPYYYPQVYAGYSYYAPAYSYYYCPISEVTPGIASTFSLKVTPAGPSISAAQPVPVPSVTTPVPVAPLPQPTPGDGTFPYDGGPGAPVPLPKADTQPMNTQPSVPLEGRPVSIPATRATPKYTYPAYGEQPRSAEREDRSTLIKAKAQPIRQVQR